MEIKLDCSKLNFKVNPQKLIQNLLNFNLGSAVTEIIDINKSIENTAFYLLYNTTHKTNIQLSKELDQEKINRSTNLYVIFNDIENEWKHFLEQEIIITKDFFENIILYNPAYLTKAFHLFEKYLNLLQIYIPENYYYKYYFTFRDNLSSEFQLNKNSYIQLVDFFNNPIETENDKFRNQIDHYTKISSFYTSKLQADVNDSNETLKDLYIEPNFEIYRRNLDASKFQNGSDFVTIKNLDIHTFLNEYFLKGIKPNDIREDYNMIFILGQPGQGKTSLCYKVVHDVLNETKGLPSKPIFFIKIRDLHARDFINDTFTSINNSINQTINFNNDKCLLILDGLDEAYMSGGLTDNDLKILYNRLNITCKQNKNLKIILTSRLNYLDINDPSLDGSLVVKLDILSDEQIKKYLDNFSKFYPKNILTKKINHILHSKDFKHIKELFQQPVLMYFIALSNININKNDSRAAIYNKIFDSLAKRSWDKNGQLSHI
ncbi:MAG TPA: ATP-binding protein, partial [Flavobacterium sp.]|nr:ATP-binding protein [Flavobacterium sp.]